MSTPDLKLIKSEAFFCVDDDIDPLIPDGIYHCKLEGWATVKLAMFNNAHKLVLSFSVIDFGEFFGTKLRAFYNVTIRGKPQRRGLFKVQKRSKFMLDFCTCFPEYQLKRADRIPMSYLEKSIIKCKVITIKNNYKQTTLPKTLRYSIVERMSGIDSV